MVGNIAIIEDDERFSARLQDYLERCGEEKGHRFRIRRFSNAVEFFEGTWTGYDVVFFDISMPYLNGMDAARRLREGDGEVTIVFITSLAQYAVDGYSVGAADFVLKPLDYVEFVLKFTRLLRHLKPGRDTSFPVQTQSGLIRVDREEIRYVESQKHNVLYHLAGETVARRTSLAQAERELGDGFARCNSCYIVNLSHVQSVKGHTVLVDGAELAVSQPRRKEFIRRYEEFVRGTQ